MGQKCVPKMGCPGKWNQRLQPAVQFLEPEPKAIRFPAPAAGWAPVARRRLLQSPHVAAAASSAHTCDAKTRWLDPLVCLVLAKYMTVVVNTNDIPLWGVFGAPPF